MVEGVFIYEAKAFGFEFLWHTRTGESISTTQVHRPPPTVKTSSCFKGVPHNHLEQEEARVFDTKDVMPQYVEHMGEVLPKKLRKKSKCTKVRGRGWLLIFGEGINMAQIVGTTKTVLVGRVRKYNYTKV